MLGLGLQKLELPCIRRHMECPASSDSFHDGRHCRTPGIHVGGFRVSRYVHMHPTTRNHDRRQAKPVEGS
jgi:hypothetical protein